MLFFFVPSNWKKNKDDTTVCFLVLTNHILSAPRREREFNKMGLFDALPPLVSSAKVKVKEDDDDDDETRHTEKKRKIGNDDEEKLKVEVVVKSSVSSMDDRLEKLSKHVEKKFSTCTRAFLELVSKPEHASALERKHGKKILLVMRRAMATHFPQSSEEYLLSFSSKKETATIFCNLFDAIEELRENGIVGKNVKVTAEMIAWELYCRTMREIAASEDSFTLNASTKRLRKAFEEAPKRKKEEDSEGDSEEEMKRKLETEIEENEHIPKEEKEEALKCALQALEAETASARELEEMHSKIREALIDCLAVAESSMRTKMWAKSIVDQLFDFVEKLLVSHDYDVFNQTQKERIVSLLQKVKANANKSNSKAGVDWVSDFDKHSKNFSKSESVSVRGSVGGERTKDGRGDGKFGER